MYIQRTLSNGIRVVAEHVPYIRSVSVGVWVGNGSRYETAEENGISHFIEHMVFKGTKTRTAREIALEMDSVGGQLNAFTTRECTCFCARVIDEHADTALMILSDMIFSPLLSAEDMELERMVVSEEIAMYEDSPEDVVYDLFDAAVWGDSPMGRPILGSNQTLARITPDSMRRYMRSHYTNKNIVIAVSGSFSEELFDKLEARFGTQAIADNEVQCTPAVYTPKDRVLWRDFEQVQLVYGFNGIDINDDAVYSLLVFNNVFGSGMSSRLFQNIREKYGLAYSIGAGHSAYIGAGTFDISAAVSPENTERVTELVMNEVRRIRTEKLTDDEIDRARIQLKGNYLLSNEYADARMQAIGRAALLGRLRTSEEIVRRIDAVDRDSVAEIIDRVLDPSTMCVVATGHVDNIGKISL